MAFEIGNEKKMYLVGITLHRYEIKDVSYLRFIRADRASKDIRILMNQLKPSSTVSGIQDNSSSSQRESVNEKIKRRRIKKLVDESE